MLRACIIDFGGSWDSHLPLAEFSYNNTYHSTIGMPPYEMLYGRKCRTPVCRGEIGQKDFASITMERNHSVQKTWQTKSKIVSDISDAQYPAKCISETTHQYTLWTETKLTATSVDGRPRDYFATGKDTFLAS
ncbi:hypothetical protein L1987_48451 [Smallanthus sonchifolius]|uniref:Uncharacterized protein n=1 Tax=Smallanthus sonchifolius TaxID=185202 RepID=A0ACB9FRT4_9ASTR|nr:hypothetical protein L1987_48451 [Smallanthus sonchifolius]